MRAFREKKKNINQEPNVEAKKVWEEERSSILQKAIDIVGPANRGKDYGHPLDNFEMEAELMNVWMKFKHKCNVQTIAEVPVIAPGQAIEFFDWKDMAIHKLFMKITRECHRHKEDNSVDLAGYSWCYEEAFIENLKRRGGSSK